MLPFLLASYGLTLIVTQSRIFRPLRAKVERVPGIGYWIKCPMCFGFWAGFFWSGSLWPMIAMPLLGRTEALALNTLAAGCVSSGFCWMVRVVLHKLGEDEL